MARIKISGKTQVDIDAEVAVIEQQRVKDEAAATVRDAGALQMDLVLHLLHISWPTMTAEQREKVRFVMSEEREQELRGALDHLIQRGSA